MEDNTSRKQIIKATGIVGGAQLFSILIGIIRTKIIAILLGPSGVGLIGILQATTELVRNATGFGINFSGVKDIAEANASENDQKISQTITILRRWALGTGILGMLVTIVLCVPLSNYSFGNDKYALSIAILSVTLFLSSIAGGQLALLQGLRQMGQMAKATLWGAVVGIAITVPFYWWLGVDGIVPGMILTALGGVFVSWWYSRKIKIVDPKLTFAQTFKGGLDMARLGFFIVVTGFVATGTMYIVRAYIIKKVDIEAVGVFQASWMIGNLYLGIVLNAMLADFFPRLSEINTDDKASNNLINEQMEIALLVGSPLIIGLIAFAQLGITILYSSKFSAAIPLLQWQMLGSFIVLIAWPLGVMFLAKNKGVFNIFTDGIWSVAYLLFVFLGWDFFGFIVLGIAYVGACLIKLIAVYFSTSYLGKFRFTNINLLYIAFFGVLTILTLFNVLYFNGYLQYFFSGIIIVLAVLFSYFKLNKIININELIRKKIFRK
ncbi:O-antigen translocase [Flavobacterium sp. LT1R49]|uniref:O-antigen translocase n=1 Tax=Flavobacterium arabinosi TaxID=3398737 RepID=UPI003A842B37